MRTQTRFLRAAHAAPGVLVAVCLIGAALLPSVVLAGTTVGPAKDSSIEPPFPISIAATPTSVPLGKSFVVYGTVLDATNGLLVSVMVKKPGKAYFSYSSCRATYDATGSVSSWWYRYAPKSRGTYTFMATCSGMNSTTRSVRVR